MSNVGEIGLHLYGNFWPKIDIFVPIFGHRYFRLFLLASLNIPIDIPVANTNVSPNSCVHRAKSLRNTCGEIFNLEITYTSICIFEHDASSNSVNGGKGDTIYAYYKPRASG